MRKRSGTRQHGCILLFAKNNRNLNRYRRRCYSISSRISGVQDSEANEED